MKKSILSVLLPALLAATPSVILAQNKAWATLSRGVLTFTYGAKPKAPTQVECNGCHKKLSFSVNYCSDCGTKNEKDFIVYDALKKEDCYGPWYENRRKIEKVVFNASFRQVNINNLEHWFDGMSNLKTIVGIEYLNTMKATSMANMFSDCSSLKTIDLSHFNTANVTDMSRMFAYCENLTSLNVSHFKTDKVTTMEYMFDSCENLTSLDVSGFNTQNVTEMGLHGMFTHCKRITELNLSNFDTRKATYLGGMFSDCQSLISVDVSSFITSQVTGYTCMFEDCSSLTSLDISNFDTRNATTTEFMFRGCCRLQTIYVSSTNWVGLKYHPQTYKPSLMGGGCNATIIKK